MQPAVKQSTQSLTTVLFRNILVALLGLILIQGGIATYRYLTAPKIGLDIPKEWVTAPLHDGVNTFKKDCLEMSITIGDGATSKDSTKSEPEKHND